MATEEEIAQRLSKLEVSKLEKEEIQLPTNLTEQSEKECRRSLLIKVIADKPISFDGLRGSLTHAWRFVRGFTLMSLGSTRFQAMFEHEEDMDRVLNGCPWFYNSFLLVIKPWKEDLDVSDSGFNIAPIWVQVWHLPLKWASVGTGMLLCSKFGIVKEIEAVAGESSYGRIIRAKVIMDISKPLIRGMNVGKGNDIRWATLKYENINFFCFYCGIIGHAVRACPQKIMDQSKGIYKDELYGPELKATPLKQKLGKSATIRHSYNSSDSREAAFCALNKSLLLQAFQSFDINTSNIADARNDKEERALIAIIDNEAQLEEERSFEQEMQEAIRLSIEEERYRKGKHAITGSSDVRGKGKDVRNEGSSSSKLMIGWSPEKEKQDAENRPEVGFPLDEDSLVEAEVRQEDNVIKALTSRRVSIKKKPAIKVPHDNDADARLFLYKRKEPEQIDDEDGASWAVVEPELKKLCLQDEFQAISNVVEEASQKWPHPEK